MWYIAFMLTSLWLTRTRIPERNEQSELDWMTHEYVTMTTTNFLASTTLYSYLLLFPFPVGLFWMGLGLGIHIIAQLDLCSCGLLHRVCKAYINKYTYISWICVNIIIRLRPIPLPNRINSKLFIFTTFVLNFNIWIRVKCGGQKSSK